MSASGQEQTRTEISQRAPGQGDLGLQEREDPLDDPTDRNGFWPVRRSRCTAVPRPA